ncbi:hypothetical protein PMAYCL1PPCAC_02681 [Pristionchus mayeri]|uniref:Uncharacterized protein n=1 Tax=Pristionchus mayeri TaxID=1317129 RepID=A0AAN4Z4M6_9BILA|nr:hypothetical protein PMAYCL1PPCAC_02681 [Pristionchus mayeri]
MDDEFMATLFDFSENKHALKVEVKDEMDDDVCVIFAKVARPVQITGPVKVKGGSREESDDEEKPELIMYKKKKKKEREKRREKEGMEWEDGEDLKPRKVPLFREVSPSRDHTPPPRIRNTDYIAPIFRIARVLTAEELRANAQRAEEEYNRKRMRRRSPRQDALRDTSSVPVSHNNQGLSRTFPRRHRDDRDRASSTHRSPRRGHETRCRERSRSRSPICRIPRGPRSPYGGDLIIPRRWRSPRPPHGGDVITPRPRSNDDATIVMSEVTVDENNGRGGQSTPPLKKDLKKEKKEVKDEGEQRDDDVRIVRIVGERLRRRYCSPPSRPPYENNRNHNWMNGLQAYIKKRLGDRNDPLSLEIDWNQIAFVHERYWFEVLSDEEKVPFSVWVVDPIYGRHQLEASKVTRDEEAIRALKTYEFEFTPTMMGPHVLLVITSKYFFAHSLRVTCHRREDPQKRYQNRPPLPCLDVYGVPREVSALFHAPRPRRDNEKFVDVGKALEELLG